MAHSATALVLGTTQSFAVLAGSTVTNTGPTVVTGDLGVSPGSAVTGFPPGLVNGGTIQAGNAVALQAQSDATTAYNALAGQACNHDLSGQDLGGLTLTPGTYCFSSSAQLTGTLTLNAEGDPAAVFSFQIGSTLTTASDSSVRMINGGNSCNVYWQVGSSATVGTGSTFMGSIIALTSITLTTGASVSGRAVARNAAVTMDTNTVSAASCQGGPDGGRPDGGSGGAGTGGSATGGDTGVSGAAGSGVGGASTGGATGTAGSGVGGASGAGGHVGTGGVAGASGGGGADAGMTTCGNVCVDLQTDCRHCGSCDHACGPSQSCVAGMCTDSCPPSAEQPSCNGLAATCGPAGNESCCTSPLVPGGTFNRTNYPANPYPATLSDFRLDKYEITVGRFRKFVAAYSQDMIPAGAGKNPNNASDPGWSTAWNTRLPTDATALTTPDAQCGATFRTWTPDAGANENRPMNCIDWYEAFAFCIWDGGRLPTEAEARYAAAGGSEQRVYPWGATVPGANASLAVYGCFYGDGTCSSVNSVAPVGSVSAGNGKWGQADLAGNVWEWTLDAFAPYPTPCTNCANTDDATSRVIHGGSFSFGASYLLSLSDQTGAGAADHDAAYGARCARSAP